MQTNPLNDEENQEEQPHDRGIPSVNEKSTGKRKRIIAIILISVILIGGALAYLKHRTTSHKAAQKPKEVSDKPSSVPRKTFEFVPDVPAVISESAPNLESAIVPPVKPIPVKDPTKDVTASPAEVVSPGDDKIVEIPVDPRLSSPIYFDDDQDKTSSSGNTDGFIKTAATTTGTNKINPLDDDEDGDQGPLNEQLKPTVTQAKNAQFTPKRDYLLPKGSIFPCNMDTSTNTTVAGMVRCKVAKNVYSDNGRVLLIEKGSEATGEYQNNVKQGQARIYVLWNSIRTPNGVEIPLDSPSADQLGGMGIPGYVDNHFWERFGGAMLISISGDAIAVLRQAGGSGTNVYNNTSGQANQMSQEALRNTINIPPTVYINQGERIQIYVARNINFESVYHVK